MKKLLLFLTLVTFISSCLEPGAEVKQIYYEDEDYEIISKTLNLTDGLDDYQLNTPNYISRSFNVSSNNAKEATLGRVLFYDKNLSKDGKVSCASCHDQKLAFGDNKAFSNGANGKLTTRNSLSLGSVLNFSVYYGDERFGRVPFFWDNSAVTVQEQSERTLANPNEMDMEMHEVVNRVNSLEYYEPLFKKAYPYDLGKANSNTVLDAISSFVNAMPAYNTKWDKELSKVFTKHGDIFDLADRTFDGFTAQENLGKNLYITKCGSCHGEAIGSPSKTRANNGLAVNYTDNGIGGRTGIQKELGVFKVPTLRNILLSAPYMHDGSLATIDDVLEHYSTGIQKHPNLDSDLKSNGEPVKFNFSQAEKDALKAFFATLTDHELMNDPRFSDPFKK